jgi:GrpB-like predicted nucleotidyltransferase (UPF0157 family)
MATIPQRPIIIAPYDINWVFIYQNEKEKLLSVLADKIIAIEHIGSTAVPNLAAKPIIDIMLGTKTLDAANACIEPLKTIEYEYMPQYEVDIPDRKFFHRGLNFPNQHFHLHVVAIHGNFWRDHLLFRDYLRTHPETLAEYQCLKQELAKKYSPDIMSYCEAKTDFIHSVVRLAAAVNS